MENVADPKEFGKRGEPLFFGQLLLLTLIFFPPKFFTVTNPSADVHALHALHISSLGDICLSLSFYNIQTPISRQSHCFILYLIPLTKSHTAKCTYVEYCDSDASIAICAADTGQLHWSGFHHRWTLLCVSFCSMHLFLHTQIAFIMPAVLLCKCNELAYECCYLQPVF